MKHFILVYIISLTSAFLSFESGAQNTGVGGNTIDGSWEIYRTNSPTNTPGNREVHTKVQLGQYFEFRQDVIRFTKFTGSGSRIMTLNSSGELGMITNNFLTSSYVPTWSSITGKPDFSQYLTQANLVPNGNVMTEAAAQGAIAAIEADISTKLNITDTTNKWKPMSWFPTWNDVSGKPSFFSGAYSDLTGKPTLFDGAYSSLTGIPSTFTPAAHNQAISTITGLQAALDGKLSAEVDGSTTNEIQDLSRTGTVLSLTGDGTTVDLAPIIPTISGSTGSFGFVTTSNGLVTSGKRLELYSGTTNASGNYTVTFGTAYSVAPNIQASITNQSNTNQQIRVVSVSTTGFTVNVFQRNAVTLLTVEVLLAAVVNVNGATVDILVTEK